ncbi:MAG: DUF2306 domain-containing protein [Phycisphaerales bacterium]|nr:DUF2306 domain-containing protein [Hyphomonadaceae bacterium]
MADTRQPPKWLGALSGVVAAAMLLAGLWPMLPQIAARAATVTFDGPDWALWAGLSWVVKLHIYAALTALAIGTAVLLLPKGRGLHKALGWGWVTVMGVTAISSLWITDLNGGMWSFIHLLSGWTLIALPMGIYAARSRKVAKHRKAMTGLFVGGLLIAGGLTFIPGRFMFEFLIG